MPRSHGGDGAAATDVRESRVGTQQTLVRCLDGIFRLLHPFMPFVSEELWSHLPWPAFLGDRPESLMAAPFPRPDGMRADEGASARVEQVQAAVSAIRNVRGEMNVPPSRRVVAQVRGEKQMVDTLRAEAETVSALAGLAELTFLAAEEPRPEKAAAAVAPGIEIFLPLAGLIDLEEEERRLRKEIEKTEAEWSRIDRKLTNQQFLERAPAEVVEKERGRATEYQETLEKLRANLERVLAAA